MVKEVLIFLSIRRKMLTEKSHFRNEIKCQKIHFSFQVNFGRPKSSLITRQLDEIGKYIVYCISTDLPDMNSFLSFTKGVLSMYMLDFHPAQLQF